MRRSSLFAALLACSLAPPATATSALAFAGQGVHYCTTGLFGTSCTVSAASAAYCGGTTEQAQVTCTVRLSAVYGIPRTDRAPSNTSCSASGTGIVDITDSLGTPYPRVVVSFGGHGGAFDFEGVAGTAPRLTAVYGRFTMNPLCGKQTGQLDGVVARG